MIRPAAAGCWIAACGATAAIPIISANSACGGALYLLALATGAWWTILSPLLMSVLLLRVSGVTLLEKDIGERRPEYAEYVARTNAFFPGPRRSA